MSSIDLRMAYAMAYPKPKSKCRCNHSGDGQGSKHTGILGHGGCKMCPCSKFSWAEYTPEFKAYMDSSPHKAEK